MDGISVKLPAALGSALAAEARRRNVTQSAIVREALERCLLNESTVDGPSCADLVRNVAGTVRSGRLDLATDKALLRETVESGYRRAAKRRR